MRARDVLRAFLAVSAAVVAAASCSTPDNPGSQGATCQVFSDCQAGYACVPQQDGSRICSNDFTPIATTEEAGGGTDAPAQQQQDGTAPTPDGGTPQPDTGGPAPDTGGPAPDTGGPAPDTGGPGPDSSAGD